MNIQNHTSNKLQSTEIDYMVRQGLKLNDATLEVWAHETGLIITKNHPSNPNGGYMYRLCVGYADIHALRLDTGRAELIIPMPVNNQKYFGTEAISTAQHYSR